MDNGRTHRFAVIVASGLFALALVAQTALADVDLIGDWEKIGQQGNVVSLDGPYPNDFTGIPLNDEGRAASLAFNPEALEQLQRQCMPWSVHYMMYGPQGIRVSAIRDPDTGNPMGLHVDPIIDRMPMDIWLDGRADLPAAAPHSSAGYTRGVWHGNTLETTTTHIKDGFLTRGGVPNSSQEVLTMFFNRHGTLLTITALVNDPVYLTAPYPWAESFRLNNVGGQSIALAGAGMRCLPEEVIEGLSDGYHTSTYLPGKNPLSNYLWQYYGIPQQAALGGEQTMSPDYQKTLRTGYKRPTAYCHQYCCGGGTSRAGGGFTLPLAGCTR
jgi:hypothetical protein